MPSVTADTNLYISALQFGGAPRALLDLARAEVVQLDISAAILNEVLRVLHRKFDFSPSALRETEARILGTTRWAQPEETLEVIRTDPSDNRILECAVAAKSDYIVTGDTRHILPLGSYAGIPIVKVAEFLRRLEESKPRQ